MYLQSMKNIWIALSLGLFISCSNPKLNPEYTVFTNATLIDGSGSAPIANSVLVIKGDSIISVGSSDTPIPDNSKVVDLKGKFIIPGLINSHGHVGTDNALENLKLYARYGITSVVSLGGEKRIFDTTSNHARLYIAGEVITSLETVDKNNAMGVDWMKIRVDDNLGTSQKMSEEDYTAIIKRSHELNYKIATHMYYLDDAKKLLVAGSDLMAHSVRDLPVDAEFITLIKLKKACYCATLTRELSTFVYGSTPDFFSDPFFTNVYPDSIIAPLKDPANQQKIRNSKSAQTYQKQLPVAMANLKTLSDRGIPIAMGTDSGIPTRFIGYFEHLEMAMMAEAGLSPMQIIKSATKDAAECMGLKGIGSLEKGFKADFVVLDENPLLDIRNTRKIDQVYISGKLLNR
jgi:imidazolonepropionase-like amidohydrolase